MTSIAALAALATMAAAGPARGQLWLLGTMDLSGLRYASVEWDHAGDQRGERHYYRSMRSVPLGAIVRETGADTRTAWQSRASRGIRKLAGPSRLTPAERLEDRINAESQRWHNDPTHW